MSWTGPDYTDHGTCDACGKHVNLDAEPPCDHGIATCDMCDTAASCLDCRLAAETEMHASDAYDPKADPFYIPPTKHIPQSERWCPIHYERGCPCGYGDRA